MTPKWQEKAEVAPKLPESPNGWQPNLMDIHRQNVTQMSIT